MNTQSLLRSPEFQALLTNDLPGYDLLTYKPVVVPPELVDRKFLMVDPEFTLKYENKVSFRQQFAEHLNFPEFTIHLRQDMERTPEYFKQLLAGRTGMVMQDEQLSGGKGTFLINDFADYTNALDALERLSKHDKVVISDMVQGARERSIQACVTGYGVYTGPLQRQIIRDPTLSNLDVAEGDKFCGAQIIADDQNTALHQQAIEVAQQVGKVLQAEGYRGIFGVDFLQSAQDELFVLEVNPRLTGVTPLLTSLFSSDEGVPFYLLHILELGGYDYTVTDDTAEFDKDGALLMLHSLRNVPITVKDLPASGTYRMEQGNMIQISRSQQIADLKPGEFIFQEYMPPGMVIKPGGRLVTLQFKGKIIDSNTDKLYNDISETITVVRNHIHTT